MTSKEIRQKYIEFFEQRGHAKIPSASLVPENDPTTLFTGSGMQPLIPYLLGEKHPVGTKLVDSQKCFRAEDIEEVGDNRHDTFFEMLGNWSLGDYFKKEQLPWFFEFLTAVAGLEPQKLYVTVFAGDAENNLPRDDESVRIWKEIFAKKGIEAKDAEMISEEQGAARGMKEGERIFYYNAKKNWWSRAGVPANMPVGEPGGPDSEVFYDFGTPHDTGFGAHCHPNCDCGRFMEIGNSVFMEYKKTENGFDQLAQKNVDFGGGLERIAAASDRDPDIFHIDSFATIIRRLEELSDKVYGVDAEATVSFRIIADHVKAAAFLIAHGVYPSNNERGYIVRRLLRRAVRHSDLLGLQPGQLHTVVEQVVDNYREAYPELVERRQMIEAKIQEEETKFRKTLEKGAKELRDLFVRHKETQITGKDLFFIYSTYGFPLELSFEELEKIIEKETHESQSYDKEAITKEFREEFKKHQELSRTTSAGTFKGGLADHSEKVVRYHTATHLLHSALRAVLGEHVLQKGSNITHERTRFDFIHPEKLTDEQKKQVEELVNKWITADYQVKKEIMPLQQALNLGALGVFGEKYADTVSIYTVWDPKTEEVVSREFCGGPHVEHTATIGKFTLQKEEAVGAGVRRVKGVIEP